MGYGDSSNLAHIVPVLAPFNTEDLTCRSALVDGGDCVHIQFLVMLGWLDIGGTLTVEEGTDSLPTTAVPTARWAYRRSAQVGTDLMGAPTDGSLGLAVPMLAMRRCYVIDVQPSQLTAGFPYVRVVWTGAGGGGKPTDMIAIIAVVTPRYSHDMVTSIVD